VIALYLLAAHLVGDFLIQTRWQALGKLEDAALRARHVLAYSLPFIPIVVVEARTGSQALSAFVLLVVLHYVTDSHRFTTTPGEWLVWHAGLREEPLAPNPWPPLPLLIDQALHVCQLALVGYTLTA
jgi:hypothetical protein